MDQNSKHSQDQASYKYPRYVPVDAIWTLTRESVFFCKLNRYFINISLLIMNIILFYHWHIKARIVHRFLRRRKFSHHTCCRQVNSVPDYLLLFFSMFLFNFFNPWVRTNDLVGWSENSLLPNEWIVLPIFLCCFKKKTIILIFFCLFEVFFLLSLNAWLHVTFGCCTFVFREDKWPGLEIVAKKDIVDFLLFPKIGKY